MLTLILLCLGFFTLLTVVGLLAMRIENRPTKQSDDYLDWYRQTRNGQTEPYTMHETPTHLTDLY